MVVSEIWLSFSAGLYSFLLLFEIIQSAVSSHLINLTSTPAPERGRRDMLAHIHSELTLQLGMLFYDNY